MCQCRSQLEDPELKRRFREAYMAEKLGYSEFVATEACKDVLTALRAILRTKEGESIMSRLVRVVRRYDDMRKELKKEYPDET